jgi:hypothetical protein
MQNNNTVVKCLISSERKFHYLLFNLFFIKRNYKIPISAVRGFFLYLFFKLKNYQSAFSNVMSFFHEKS